MKGRWCLDKRRGRRTYNITFIHYHNVEKFNDMLVGPSVDEAAAPQSWNMVDVVNTSQSAC